MDNIKIHNIDGNKLVEDLEKNKYWIIFKNYLGEEIKSEIPKDIFDTYIKFKNIYKKNQNEEERHWEHIELSLFLSAFALLFILNIKLSGLFFTSAFLSALALAFILDIKLFVLSFLFFSI